MIRGVLDSLLDASILLSFDRSGFERHARRFDRSADECRLSDRVCLVTGANSGIGLATALELARRDAEVWLLCRDVERGERAAAEVRATSGNAKVFAERLDLSCPVSIEDFVKRFSRPHIDVLIHNAGVLPASREETSEGLELTFATHVVGPHRLTRACEPLLRRAENARVIFVSSGGMYAKRLSLQDLDWRRRRYDGVAAYAQTKRMQVVLSELWAKELAGTGVVCHAMHPGWASTPGVERSLPGFSRWMRGRLRSARQGADTIVWLASAKEPAETSGGFFFDRRPAATHLPLLAVITREGAKTRTRLWELCESLCNARRPLAEAVAV